MRSLPVGTLSPHILESTFAILTPVNKNVKLKVKEFLIRRESEVTQFRCLCLETYFPAVPHAEQCPLVEGI